MTASKHGQYHDELFECLLDTVSIHSGNARNQAEIPGKRRKDFASADS